MRRFPPIPALLAITVAAVSLVSLHVGGQTPRSGNPILAGWYADPEATYSSRSTGSTLLFSSVWRADIPRRVLVERPRIMDEAFACAGCRRCDLGKTRRLGAVGCREGWQILPVLRCERYPERQSGRRQSAWPGHAIPAGHSRIISAASRRQVRQRRAADRSLCFQGRGRHVLPDLRRLAALQRGKAERGLYRLRAVS